MTKSIAERRDPQQPWRDVAYIGVQTGAKGGRVWRLVLDTCGHVEFRKVKQWRYHRRVESLLAPKRVVCTSCTFGQPHVDVGEAVELARRLESVLLG